jgi:hypothetical protein
LEVFTASCSSFIKPEICLNRSRSGERTGRVVGGRREYLPEACVWEPPEDRADVDSSVEAEDGGEECQQVNEHVVTLLSALHQHLNKYSNT